MRFFRLIAARHKGCIQAIEVLNETNLDREWVVLSGELRAADYVAFLRKVPPVLCSIDRRLNHGRALAGRRKHHLEDYGRAGGLNWVDCIGVHLNGYNMPPDKRWNEGYDDPTARFRGPFDNPHHSWSFISTIEGYRQRTNKPMCATESGTRWPSARPRSGWQARGRSRARPW